MKRFGKHKTEQLKIEARLTEGDKAELVHFKEYLGDSKNLSKSDLLKKHGEYMGFTPAELESLNG